MPRPRKQQISLDATPYYHCTSRCVRRAFLCGLDALTGNDYEHRRQWVEDRIVFLGEVFCIDICAYAVMSNHHHLVLHINAAEAHTLSDLEVAKRWHTLYKGTPLTQAFVKGGPLDDAQRQAVKEKLDQWRLELASISRFMWALNEPIARRANAEDHCTGRFWESRFKSQALLDEKALAACMAYVDLNPVRAKMATTPESSEHTSIKRRIEALKAANTHPSTQPLKLAEFVGNPREPMPQGLPFHLKDYIQLVDITGRAIREHKRGFIDNNLPPILERLNITSREWLTLTTQFESTFKSLVGCKAKLMLAAKVLGLKRRPAFANCEAIFH
ncbi:hypothetical protein [Teredinibacter purpureus]|uniref:hypothetical protein n=1 Tax=Teredinibacter purpureus TaxID=2731756 RepID=UPI0005F8400B|nr:hypothetical protein [Teredinibacter purpureus]